MNPPDFNPEAYGPVIAELLQERRLMPLGPGSPNREAHDRLKTLSPATAFGHARVRDESMALACCAGLYLYHDYLDESHRISQDIATATGSYWHGIMHRREPDASNAAYWFRRVGAHPIFETLNAEAARIASAAGPEPAARFLMTQAKWDSFAFIDLCENARTGRSNAERLCRQVQQWEWELLFDYCYREAVGG